MCLDGPRSTQGGVQRPPRSYRSLARWTDGRGPADPVSTVPPLPCAQRRQMCIDSERYGRGASFSPPIRSGHLRIRVVLVGLVGGGPPTNENWLAGYFIFLECSGPNFKRNNPYSAQLLHSRKPPTEEKERRKNFRKNQNEKKIVKVLLVRFKFQKRL